MDVIYTDSNLVDIGVLQAYELDYSIGGDNTYSIVSDINGPLVEGGIFYVEGQEYGGFIDQVKIDTKSGRKTSSGRTWRGFLSSYFLEPDAGEDYLNVSGDLGLVIDELITRFDLDGLFVSGTNVDEEVNYNFNRYTDFYSGLVSLLKTVGAKLTIVWDPATKKVEIGSSYVMEYVSDSDKVNFIIQKSAKLPNAVIGLGSGELSNRTVIKRYIDASGDIVENNPYSSGTDVWFIKYDYPNAESVDELVKGAVDELLEARSASDYVDIAVNDVNLDVGDQVTAVEVSTGTSVTAEVTEKILKVKNDKISTSYKVN